MITPHQLAVHLLSRELLTREAIVNGPLTIIDRSRHNHNFQIMTARGPCYFTKQARGLSRTLEHEANMYRLISRRGERLARYIPSFCHYDREYRLLVLQLVKRARSVSEILAGRKRIDQKIASELGRAVATIHDWLPPSPVPPTGSPFILTLPHPKIELFRDMSGGNIELVRIVQESKTLCRELERLRVDWRPDAIIHNDLRFGNCLVSKTRRRGRQWAVKIADWELAGLGDASWDVACVFADFLTLWVFSMPFLPGSSPVDLFRSARLPLAPLQPAMKSFWQTYVSTRRFSGSQAEEFLLRALRFAAARVIELTYEWMQQSHRLTGNAVTLLQLSLNITMSPERAALTLLGIERRQAHG